jgi:glycosyltransferase involved in cell wall biosynthesis
MYSEHNQIYSASPRLRRRFSYYLRLADHVVAVSHDLRRELKERAGAGTVDVIHNGIDSVPVTPGSRDRIRAELGARSDDVLIGTVAVLSRQKGIAHLLEAAAQVAPRLPAAKFVVVGDGPLRESLAAQAAEAGLVGRVIFTGYRKDIPLLMDALDIYAQPSLWEGLPLVLLEALRAGKPIVATKVGGNPEVVEHERNGLLVEPGDAAALAGAIVRVATDEQFRAAVPGVNVAKFQRDFALDSMVAAHVNAYSRLASGLPRR